MKYKVIASVFDATRRRMIANNGHNEWLRGGKLPMKFQTYS